MLIASPALYLSIIEHSNALKSLQREHQKHLEREKALGEILDTLRTGYNPNYQDMAVLEAVRGWEELAGLPHINDVNKASPEGDDEGDDENKEETTEDVLDDGTWSAEKLETELNMLVASDYVSLLLEHEEHIRTPHDEGSICELHFLSIFFSGH